jgi:hypothetical protein
MSNASSAVVGARERGHELVHLDERARPPVQEEQRQRLRAVSAHAGDVQVDAADAHALSGQHVVEPGGAGVPVETVPPVADELAEKLDVGAALPAVAERVGPSGGGEAAAEIAERDAIGAIGEPSEDVRHV